MTYQKKIRTYHFPYTSKWQDLVRPATNSILLHLTSSRAHLNGQLHPSRFQDPHKLFSKKENKHMISESYPPRMGGRSIIGCDCTKEAVRRIVTGERLSPAHSLVLAKQAKERWIWKQWTLCPKALFMRKDKELCREILSIINRVI